MPTAVPTSRSRWGSTPISRPAAWASANAASPSDARYHVHDVVVRIYHDSSHPLVAGPGSDVTAARSAEFGAGEIAESVEDFYGRHDTTADPLPAGLDGALRAIERSLAVRRFDDSALREEQRVDAAAENTYLVGRCLCALQTGVFRARSETLWPVTVRIRF